MQKKTIFIGAVLLALIAGIAMLVSSTGSDKEPPTDGQNRKKTGIASQPASNRPRPAKRATEEGVQQDSGKKVRRPIPQITFDDPDYPYSEEDKRVARELQDALDECTEDSADDESDENDGIFAKKQSESLKKLMKKAEVAAGSENPSVRMWAVDAYSWVGKDALPELTPMMADSNENVSEQAIEAVEQSLVDIDDPGMRFQLASAYMGTLSVNENALSMLGGISSGAALELVEPASDSPADVAAAQQNRLLFVDAVNALIEDGQGKCGEQAQNLYEEVTGSKWINASEGVRWAQDPDDYEAPEASEVPGAPEVTGAQSAPNG